MLDEDEVARLIPIPDFAARMRSFDFDGIPVEGALVDGYRAEGLPFSHVEVRTSVMRECDFSTCAFDGAIFFEVDFVNCDFSSADFSDASFELCTFNRCMCFDVEAQESSWSDTVARASDFKFADFADAHMSDVEFVGCQLEGASFDGAELMRVEK